MRFNKQLSHALVASLFIFSTGSSHLAHANRMPTATLSASEIQSIDNLIAQLDSTDARKSSGAAESLGSYPYQEVQDSLVRKIEALLKDHNAFSGYSFTITKGLESLAKISTKQDAADIARLSSEFET
ncbi:MAG: hypothetical protein AAB250_08585, partial [Bdellovibrionota bacterium]